MHAHAQAQARIHTHARTVGSGLLAGFRNAIKKKAADELRDFGAAVFGEGLRAKRGVLRSPEMRISEPVDSKHARSDPQSDYLLSSTSLLSIYCSPLSPARGISFPGGL